MCKVKRKYKYYKVEIYIFMNHSEKELTDLFIIRVENI